jgi:hypothetical protein
MSPQRVWSVQIPAKLFLLGEYVAVEGGPSLIGTFAPGFRLEARSSPQAQVEGIHPDSPAGRILREHRDELQAWAVRFFDPFEGRGGLGASSAQFLGAQAFLQSVRGPFSDWRETRSLWAEYRDWTRIEGGSLQPSGADYLAQLQGGPQIFVREPFATDKVGWPEASWRPVAIRTGEKVKTHTHLAATEGKDLARLRVISRRGVEAFRAGDWEVFFQASRDFSGEQKRLGLLAGASEELCRAIERKPGVLLARGTGAMGADIVLAYVRADSAATARDSLDGFEVVDLHPDSAGTVVRIEVAP